MNRKDVQRGLRPVCAFCRATQLVCNFFLDPSCVSQNWADEPRTPPIRSFSPEAGPNAATFLTVLHPGTICILNPTIFYAVKSSEHWLCWSYDSTSKIAQISPSHLTVQAFLKMQAMLTTWERALVFFCLRAWKVPSMCKNCSLTLPFGGGTVASVTMGTYWAWNKIWVRSPSLRHAFLCNTNALVCSLVNKGTEFSPA